MFAVKLNQIRKEKGYTAQYMADELVMTIGAYRKYENGRTSPPLDNLIKMADILNVSLDNLVGRDFPK